MDKRVAELAVSVTRLNDKHTALQQQKTLVDAHLVGAMEEYVACQEAQRLVQCLAQDIQNQIHRRISDIVTRCLAAVFVEDPYEFKIHFEMKRGKTEARLTFVRNGIEVDPLTASGGGVVDVASFALRLAALVLSKPKRRPLLVLDEPFRFVSANYRDRVRQLLQALSDDLGIQIIMVTHDPSLQIGSVVEIGG